MNKNDKKPLLPKEIVEQGQKIFLAEVGNRLKAAEEAMRRFLADANDEEAYSVLYKFAHTLKGSGEMVNLKEISVPAGEIITALTLVRNYEVKINSGFKRFFRERMDEIRKQTALYPPTGNYTLIAEKTDEDHLRSKKILVVDDDPTITTLIRDYLTERGFIVKVCHKLSDAERLIMSEQPDLMILDIIFPSGNGIEFCKKIRSNQTGKVVPIIFLSVKAKLQDRLSGFACGADDFIAKPFIMEELFARITAIFSRMQKYEQLVMEDELTGVFNRRYLLQRLHEEINQAKLKNAFFSLMMIDLDNFKEINDSYGHRFGDHALQFFVDIIKTNLRKTNLRKTDVLCRCGGDEFVIIMPGTDHSEAVSVLERVRRTLLTSPYQIEETEFPLTFSAGVVSYPTDGLSADELLTAADQAMYRAKKLGGNQVFPGR